MNDDFDADAPNYEKDNQRDEEQESTEDVCESIESDTEEYDEESDIQDDEPYVWTPIRHVKLEITIDHCMKCPFIECLDPTTDSWCCGKTKSPLKRSSMHYFEIPANCPLERVDENNNNPEQQALASEEPFQSGVDPL